MFKRTQQVHRRNRNFFLVALSHDSLANFYKMNFSLMQYHHYSLADIENMIPFEREIYIAMLVEYLEEQKEKKANQ